MSAAPTTPVWSAQSTLTTPRPAKSWLVSAPPDAAAMNKDVVWNFAV